MYSVNRSRVTEFGANPKIPNLAKHTHQTSWGWVHQSMGYSVNWAICEPPAPDCLCCKYKGLWKVLYSLSDCKTSTHILRGYWKTFGWEKFGNISPQEMNEEGVGSETDQQKYKDKRERSFKVKMQTRKRKSLGTKEGKKRVEVYHFVMPMKLNTRCLLCSCWNTMKLSNNQPNR